MNDKVDLILHPIRMRIIQALVGDRKLTAQQIGQLLNDVPQATLYRHLNKLTKAGLITIAEERPIRGTIEKVYAFAQGGNVTPDDIQEMDRTEHMRYFMQFVSTLISDFGRYLEQETIDFGKDGVGYRKLPFYLNDEEFHNFLTELRSFMKPYAEIPPAPGRRRRMLTTIFLPEPDLSSKENGIDNSNDTDPIV